LEELKNLYLNKPP